ncbi:hypothetical protein GCM10022419_045970 [Nonomuraea rosea]|uniref:Uncharacterized protein n=1 Tax=Nonomuraea rosea TaxID=638574 RepID=A0ABP6X7E7_9ACTN
MAAGERDVIERIHPLQVLVRSLRRTPRARAALVPLAHPSHYGEAGPRLDRDVAERALERSGEIWSALIDLKLARRTADGQAQKPLRERRLVKHGYAGGSTRNSAAGPFGMAAE